MTWSQSSSKLYGTTEESTTDRPYTCTLTICKTLCGDVASLDTKFQTCSQSRLSEPQHASFPRIDHASSSHIEQPESTLPQSYLGSSRVHCADAKGLARLAVVRLKKAIGIAGCKIEEMG